MKDDIVLFWLASTLPRHEYNMEEAPAIDKELFSILQAIKLLTEADMESNCWHQIGRSQCEDIQR